RADGPRRRTRASDRERGYRGRTAPRDCRPFRGRGRCRSRADLMIPSLVVSEITDGLLEYLSTTFALSDDDVHDALEQFLSDHADGIFRGPYLRVRLPFESVDPEWE